MNRTRPASLAITLLLAVSTTTACGGSGGADGETVLRVQAAASLTDTFDTLAAEFEARNPGVSVEPVYDSSGALAEQATDQAPGDVLATADTLSMETAVDGGAVAEGPTPFATNTLVLVVPAGNPAGITSLADLGSDDVTYVACVDTAPCGGIAARLLDDAGLTNEPASLEPDVKATLARVTADEADAGLVYATDALAAGDAVETIEVPEAAAVPTTYPIAVLEQSEDPGTARAFVDLVLSEEGRRVLADAGFGGP